jgi:hypothetical protein
MTISSSTTIPDTICTTGNESSEALGGFRDNNGEEEVERNAAPKTKLAVRYYEGRVSPKTSKVRFQYHACED